MYCLESPHWITILTRNTHWGQDIKGQQFADNIFKFSWRKILVLIQILLTFFFCKILIDDKSPLLQIMTWHQTEPIIIQYTDKLIHHEGQWVKVPWDFTTSHWSVWMVSSGHGKLFENMYIRKNVMENLSHFVFSSVPAYGLWPLGARTSAGTVMTRSCIFVGPATKGLTKFMCPLLAVNDMWTNSM